MEKRSVSLVGYASATLTFRYWARTEATWDFVTVNVRNQSGSWTELWRSSGDSGGWKSQTVNLSSFAGQSGLYIQFRFDSDSSANSDGVWLDEIVLTATSGQPDLTKTTDNISRTAGSPGDTFTMTLRVKNQGDAASAATKVNFYLHKDSEDFSDASKVGEVNLGGLAAGATSAELRFDYVFPNNKPAGNYFFAYWIDAPGLVAESNENNNKWWWANIPIIGGTDGATLVSQTIADGTVMSPGQNFTQSWTLRNTGTTTWTTGVDGYTLNLVAGTDRMGAANTYLTLANPVAPNGQATFSVQLAAPAAPGTYTGNWRMNSAALTDFGPTVSVKIVVSAIKPDLTKSSDNISRTAGSRGDTFTMTLRVKNQGDAASAATKVNFYLHKDSEDFSDASKVGEVNLGGLAAGATSAELRFDYVFPNNKPPGNYFFAYWIDAPGLVAESNENNNKWWWSNITIGGVPPQILQNNVQVSNLSGAQGSQKHYKINVPLGQTNLDIKISGGTGDCDLHVKFGAPPTTSSYDFRPYLGGNNESVSVNSPAAGDWYVMLNGYSSYSAVTLLASYSAVVSTVATPQISPSSGSYNNSVTVTMSTTTSGASVYYTLNGSDPTTSSTLYGGAFTVTGSATVKARAYKSGMNASAIASESYAVTTTVTTLQNNVPIANLSGTQGSQKLYKITVPSGQTKLDISIAGGTGDCDLYVKYGSAPTTSSYDYRPYSGGNNETVGVNNPAAGDWYVMLNGYSSYSGVTLLTRYQSMVVTEPVLLQNNTPVTGLSGTSGNETFYKIIVPPGQSRLEIRTFGGSGDCDLYVKLGFLPTTSSYTYRSVLSGNNETVMLLNPAAGSWFIMLKGASAYSAITFNARYGPVGGNNLLKAAADALGANFFSRYAQGEKYLLYASGSVGLGAQVADLVDVGATVYADLDDYLGVTLEGWNGDWVTLWLRGNASVLSAGFPLSAGVDTREFNLTDNLPDREFPLEASLLNATGPGLEFSAVDFSLDGGIEPGGITLGAVGWSVSLFDIQTPSLSAEVQRQPIDLALSNAFFPGLAPSMIGLQMMTHLFDPDHSTTVNGHLGTIVWRFPVRLPSDKTDNSN